MSARCFSHPLEETSVHSRHNDYPPSHQLYEHTHLSRSRRGLLSLPSLKWEEGGCECFGS